MQTEHASSIRFEQDGFVVIPELITPQECLRYAEACEFDGPGTRRLMENEWCRKLASSLMVDSRLAALLPDDAVAVQCTYFNKRPDRNWLVAYHQDLTIPVFRREDVPDYVGWSTKEYGVFVQPPQRILEQLTAVRLHLDENETSNGPLRLLPGTHRRGRLSATEIESWRAGITEFICTAPIGSALVMRPLLLHASSKSTVDRPRRTLHYLFGPPRLDEPVQWRIDG